MNNDKNNFAYYHTFTDEEKNQWWLAEYQELYENIDLKLRIHMDYASRNVAAYVNAKTKEERDHLWHLYDSLTQCYCDVVRWHNEANEKRQLYRLIHQHFPKTIIL